MSHVTRKDALTLRNAATHVLRYGLTAQRWARTLRDFRCASKCEIPPVLLRVAVEANRQPGMTARELAAWLCTQAEAVEQARGR